MDTARELSNRLADLLRREHATMADFLSFKFVERLCQAL
jgi:hypothetical protein